MKLEITLTFSEPLIALKYGSFPCDAFCHRICVLMQNVLLIQNYPRILSAE